MTRNADSHRETLDQPRVTRGQDDPWSRSWAKARALYPNDLHEMPQPVWAVRGYADDGSAAWSRLTPLLPQRRGAISIYAHIPFCHTRCPFCDCHATAIPRSSLGQVERYVRRFERETEEWGALEGLAERPVTTVHFGGGTPNALPPPEFDRAVQAVAARFAVDEQTEWAIETSCRCLDEEHAARLADLGFTRIHVGVQTLRPRLRSMLGRRNSPDTVLERIDACLSRGWVVSVDMLYGLPGQTPPDLLEDLKLLITEGVHGVSLYRLNHSGRNHPFMARHGLANRGVSRLYADYRMFMEAADLLASCGYAKNHFTHFAKAEDRNLYYRHAVRGEDLLALGASADGLFGDYYYRHPELAGYLASANQGPPLEGGGFFTPAEERARRLVAGLMSGQILDAGPDAAIASFVGRLESAGLLSQEDSSHCWRLTDAGSWFVGACTADALHAMRTAGGT